jgi:TPR repeat protein
MYEEGRGVKQDYRESLKWYQIAASQGYLQAQNNLGRLYAEGRGAPQDYVRAYMWFKMAASRGVVTAQRNLLESAKMMIPPQIIEAQRMARDCEMRDYKGCDDHGLVTRPISVAPQTQSD